MLEVQSSYILLIFILFIHLVDRNILENKLLDLISCFLSVV